MMRGALLEMGETLFLSFFFRRMGEGRVLDPAKAGEEEFGVGLGVLEVGDEDFHGFRCGELGELTSELGHALLLVRVEE